MEEAHQTRKEGCDLGWWRWQLDSWVLACIYISNWPWLHQDSLCNKLSDPTYINSERISEIQGSEETQEERRQDQGLPELSGVCTPLNLWCSDLILELYWNRCWGDYQSLLAEPRKSSCSFLVCFLAHLDMDISCHLIRDMDISCDLIWSCDLISDVNISCDLIWDVDVSCDLALQQSTRIRVTCWLINPIIHIIYI